MPPVSCTPPVPLIVPAKLSLALVMIRSLVPSVTTPALLPARLWMCTLGSVTIERSKVALSTTRLELARALPEPARADSLKVPCWIAVSPV